MTILQGIRRWLANSKVPKSVAKAGDSHFICWFAYVAGLGGEGGLETFGADILIWVICFEGGGKRFWSLPPTMDFSLPSLLPLLRVVGTGTRLKNVTSSLGTYVVV